MKAMLKLMIRKIPNTKLQSCNLLDVWLAIWMKKCLFKNLYTYRVVEITVYFVPLIYERKKKYPKKLHLTSNEEFRWLY